MSSLYQNLTRITSRGNWVLLAVFTLLGAILSASAFGLIVGRSEAVGTVEIGRTTRTGGDFIAQNTFLPIESLKILIERMQSAEFLSAIAKRLNDPSAANALLEKQYGGDGDLQASIMRDELAIQIRARGINEGQAISRAEAAMQEIVAQHEIMHASILALKEPIRTMYQSQIAGLKSEISELTNQITIALKRAPDTALYMLLLAEKYSADNRLYDMQYKLYQFEVSTQKPYYLTTHIIMGPRLRLSIFSSPLRTGLLGALIGLALGFVVIQMRKMIV